MPSLYRLLRAPSTLPRLDAGEESWRTRALCAQKVNRGELPAWLWDDKTGQDDEREDVDSRVRRVTLAAEICGRCTVRAECLADVDLDIDEGIRAGIDLRDRRRKRRESA